MVSSIRLVEIIECCWLRRGLEYGWVSGWYCYFGFKVAFKLEYSSELGLLRSKVNVRRKIKG